MGYNPDKQYRCTIIRGKTKNELDDLLPAYAKTIKEICPADEKTFREKFNAGIAPFLSSPTKKTLDNHRTEIAGKLFGMWKKGEDNLVYPTERTERLLDSGDNPQFFKSLIMKIQFPNGMDKLNTIKERIGAGIKIRPCAFVLKALMLAEEKDVTLTQDEVAYYILNNLDVLKGEADVNEVINKIIERRREKVFKKVETPGKASSYSSQHIRELLNLMELANLIRIVREKFHANIILNRGESASIKYIADGWNKAPAFDMYKYNLKNGISVKEMYRDWDEHYTKPEKDETVFATSTKSLIHEALAHATTLPAIEIATGETGEEGELIVFAHEKERVKKFSERLVNKVIYFGKQKGLGFDISSIKADGSLKSEHAIYIEVKSTKRVTAPRKPLKDQFDMTRNEWVAAEQHGDSYYIYRVYITNDGLVVFVLNDPVQLRSKSKIYAEPLKYHVEFDHNSGELISW